MRISDLRFVRACHFFCAVVIGPVGTSLADIGPPVAVKLPANTAVAIAGEEYEGAFEIRVYKPGDLTDFRIEGEGWRVASSTLPTASLRAPVGTISVKFKAIPTNPDEPLGLSLRYNGRLVRTLYEVGPAHAARKAQPRLLTRIPNTSGLRAGQVAGVEVPDQTSSSAKRGGAIPIRVVGRLVYDRPGNDQSLPPDGDFDDPGDVPPAIVGAHYARIDLIDTDDIALEIMWSGHADEHGYFDTEVISWDDCDITCDTPDLILRVRALTGVSVVVRNLEDDTYVFSLPEMENFEGEFHDYGWIRPATDMMPAFHILKNLARAKLFAFEEAAMPGDPVIAYWPDDSQGNNAWYSPGEKAIHLSTGRQWRTDTILHEFGHHHNDSYYVRQRPDPNYCDPEMDCDLPPPAGCGHCMWCDENVADAWFEGWANWFADVVTRDYPNRYTFDDGTPFQALYTRDQENPGTCDGSYDSRIATEGFVGALLRDIEDETQDDHDDDPDPANVTTDGIFDSLCLGADRVFRVTYNHEPITVVEFISGFLAELPIHTDELWPTAFNVGGGDYVTPFPADTQPPGRVSGLSSPTHPLGQGGSLACMTFEFDPAPDDVTGASFYSYIVTMNPLGEEPNEITNTVRGTDNCRFEGTVAVYELGEYYVSIKAQDNAGNWSSQYETFGPFEVLDCNNSGILDICDIDCNVTSIPDMCNFGVSPCAPIFSCLEISNDCNGNWKPDECDVASLESEDCDVNGIPDECQEIKHWTGEAEPPDQTQWGNGDNWEEQSPPVHLDTVCIPADAVSGAVYDRQETILTSLACRLGFVINGPSTSWLEHLELNENSFVLGNMTLWSTSTLTVNHRLYVDGLFFWGGGTINGPGVTEVNGGLAFSGTTFNLWNGSLFLSGGEGISNGKRMTLNPGATMTIGTQATYTYDGDSFIFYGSGGLVDVRGLLTRNSGDATATILTPVNNSGTIRNKSGTLTFGWGGSHAGQFIGDLGTTLKFARNHTLSSTSALTAANVDFGSGTSVAHGTINISDTILGTGATWTFADDANIISYGDHVNVNRGRVNFEAPTGQPIDLQTVTITTTGESSGTIDFNTGQPVNVETFSMLRGSLYGSSPINVSGTLTWTNGTFRTGGAITANGPVVINATSSSRTIFRVLNITDQAVVYSGFGVGGSASVNIFDSVVFNMQFNSGGVGGGTINNFGTVLRSSGSGQISISAAMMNSGLVHNQSGTLSLGGGGTYSGVVRSDPGTLLKLGKTTEFLPESMLIADDIELYSGTNATIGGTVNISGSILVNGGTWTFTDEADIVSYGPELTLDTGTIRFEAPTDEPIEFDTVTVGTNTSGGKVVEFYTGQPVNIGTLNLIKGNINGPSPVNVSDLFTWSGGGGFSTGGALTLNGDSRINYTSSARTSNRNIFNAGNCTILGSYSLGSNAQINNLPAGVYDIQGNTASISSGSFHNAGLLVKSAGTGVGQFQNTDLFNTGTVEIQTAELEFNSADFIQTAGQTILNGGDLRMATGGRPVQINGGSLSGVGTVFGEVVNGGGSVEPGLSAGTLTIDGDYTQQAGGMLTIEAEGLTPDTEHDQLIVTGAAMIDGTLAVEFINGYVPNPGDSFVVLTAGTLSGTFPQVIGPGNLSASYENNQVTVTVNTAPCGIQRAADVDFDCDVDLDDHEILVNCLSGPGEAVSGSCLSADIDNDGHVGIRDYSRLQRCFGDVDEGDCLD